MMFYIITNWLVWQIINFYSGINIYNWTKHTDYDIIGATKVLQDTGKLMGDK